MISWPVSSVQKHHTRITLQTMIWLGKKNSTNFHYFQHLVMKNLKQCSHLLTTYILQLFCGVVSTPCLCVHPVLWGISKQAVDISTVYLFHHHHQPYYKKQMRGGGAYLWLPVWGHTVCHADGEIAVGCSVVEHETVTLYGSQEAERAQEVGPDHNP